MLENKGIKRPPIGMSDFRMVRNNNKYYVDKTMYIPQLEKISNFLFLIRPRRFGKSIFLSMIADYYDCENKELDQEFEGTWISEHPQPLKGQFQILQYDFSQVLGQTNHLEDDFNTYCCGQLDMFIQKYGKYYSAETVKWALEAKKSKDKINLLSAEAKERGYHLYLIIDEYDNFTNTVLNEQGEDVYHNMTHSSGFYRSAFKIFKPNFERILFMGVSPITLNDLTSGFNIATNISLHPAFNMMLGFSEEDVREMIVYYQSVGLIQPSKDDKGNTIDGKARVDEIIADMKPWYDNYCFAINRYGQVTMYNSVMVLYFIDQYIHNNCDIPRDMIEDNIRVDYNKLRMLIRHDKEFAHDASIIQHLVTDGFVTGNLKRGFPAESINNPDNFVSLLFYFGMLTIDGTYRGKTKFVIPNEVVREQIYAYLLSTYKENELAYDTYQKSDLESGFAYDGDYKSYFGFIADAIKRFSSQRDRQKGESYVHGFTLAMTCQNMFYRPISELDNQAGYADIFLRPLLENYPDMEHSYIVELKYCKSDATDEQVAKLREAAIAQVNRYADSDVVKSEVKTTRLHKIVVIFRSVDMVVCEEIE